MWASVGAVLDDRICKDGPRTQGHITCRRTTMPSSGTYPHIAFEGWRRTAIPDNSNTFPHRLQTILMEDLATYCLSPLPTEITLTAHLVSFPTRTPRLSQAHYIHSYTHQRRHINELYAHARTTERPHARDPCGSWAIPILLRHNTEQPRLSPPDDSASGDLVEAPGYGLHNSTSRKHIPQDKTSSIRGLLPDIHETSSEHLQWPMAHSQHSTIRPHCLPTSRWHSCWHHHQ